jgi:HAE1 family hydrophobic/amphiphilic exporter-1
MAEVTSAVIATALVLGAVFVPVAFFPGTTGRLYQQFALTIAFSMALSAFNALTLTPALSAALLRGERQKGTFFRLFNRAFDAGSALLMRVLRLLIRARWAVAALFVAALGLTVWVYRTVPSASSPKKTRATSSSSCRPRRAPRWPTRPA